MIDQLTLLIVGAILGRLVVAGRSFFSALQAAGVIVFLHKLMAYATFKSKKLGVVFKGKPIVLKENGAADLYNMVAALITEEDIQEALHLQLHTSDVAHIDEARLERSGRISFFSKNEQSSKN